MKNKFIGSEFKHSITSNSKTLNKNRKYYVASKKAYNDQNPMKSEDNPLEFSFSRRNSQELNDSPLRAVKTKSPINKNAKLPTLNLPKMGIN